MRILAKRTICHNFKRTLVPRYSGNHPDIIFQYHGTPITVALRPLPLPLKAYKMTLNQGTILGTANGFEIRDHDLIKDLAGGELNINGQYFCNDISSFPPTEVFTRIQ